MTALAWIGLLVGCRVENGFATVEPPTEPVVHSGSTVPPPDPPPVEDTALDTPDLPLTPCQAPRSTLCAPGRVIELSFPITADDMWRDVRDDTGPGQCCGDVRIRPDLDRISVGRGDDGDVQYNGDDAQVCDEPHCDGLWFGDGHREQQACTVWAMCRDGVATAVGWSW